MNKTDKSKTPRDYAASGCERCRELEAELETVRRETLEMRVKLEEINLQLEQALTRAQSMVVAAESHDLITKTIFNSISSILIGVNDEGVIAEWNQTAATLLGVARDAAIGKSFNAMALPWQWERIKPTWDRCSTSSDHAIIDDVRYIDPAGNEGRLEVTVSPILWAVGEKAGRLILAVDQTEKKRLQDELRQAEKMRSVGQLAAGIAHEINTPTQYIGDNSRFLAEACESIFVLLKHYDNLRDVIENKGDSTPSLDEIKKIIEDIDLDFLYEEVPLATKQCIEGVDRVTRIVKGMKDFAHPDSGEKTEADLNELIESTTIVTRNEWKYVSDLVTDFDPNLPLVSCLPAEVNQVVLNLIVNAAHAITDALGENPATKGRITITTRQKNGFAVVSVRDTGTGIPEEAQSRVFEPFFTTKEVGRGTGQGLAIAYSIITEKHGGTIEFETEKNKGTTFVIRLPLEAQPVTTE